MSTIMARCPECGMSETSFLKPCQGSALKKWQSNVENTGKQEQNRGGSHH